MSEKSSNFALEINHYSMKRLFIALTVLSMVVLPVMGERFEPAPRDDGMIRNLFRDEKQRQVFYHVARPEGCKIYRCANAKSKTVAGAPYGALLTVHWSDPKGWTKVSCPDYAHNIVYHGYIPSAYLRKIDRIRITNPKGARIEEYIENFRNRKPADILPQGKEYNVEQIATHWGYIKIHYRFPNYNDCGIVRMSDIQVVESSPIALKSEKLPTFVVRDDQTAPLMFPREKKVGNERVITGWDTVGYLKPGTQMVFGKYDYDNGNSLVYIETLNMDTVTVGMVPKKALRMEGGMPLKRWLWNTRSSTSHTLASEKAEGFLFNFKTNLRVYFDRTTNNPNVSNWQKYKWHLWGVLGWIAISYLLLVLMAMLDKGIMDILYFLWMLIPPYLYLETNPHSLWFSDPSCVGWTWAFFGLVVFIALSAWFWANFKKFGLRLNGANLFTSIVGIVFGWACGYIMVKVLLATFNQDLGLLALAVIFSWFGWTPAPLKSEQGKLMDSRGNSVEGHLDAGDPNRFYGKDGKVYEKDGSGNFHPKT